MVTNGYKYESIDILFIMCILSGIFVIMSKNPIVSVLCLIFLFSAVSCYLIVLGLNFIGLSYLLVYVGAVSILFLFILMLINIRVSELVTENKNSIALAFMTGIIVYDILSQILPNNDAKLDILPKKSDIYLKESINKNNNITCVTSNSWDRNLGENTHISSIGNILYTNYSIWLIITSIILLLAMVGSIIITLKPRA
jgi:NADH-ubiquinone oxidoreductase chain 6